MSDLRGKIARALFDQDFSGANRRASEAAWILVRDRTDEDSTWHRAADAVLAVLDDVRAEGWDEGATAARAENFMADDFTETTNPYERKENR